MHVIGAAHGVGWSGSDPGAELLERSRLFLRPIPDGYGVAALRGGFGHGPAEEPGSQIGGIRHVRKANTDAASTKSYRLTTACARRRTVHHRGHGGHGHPIDEQAIAEDTTDADGPCRSRCPQVTRKSSV